MADLKKVFRFRHMNPRINLNPGWGVYIICHVPTARVYVGSTEDSFANRLRTHLRALRGGGHHNGLLRADWEHYGEGEFYLGPAIEMQAARTRYNSYIFEYLLAMHIRDHFGPQYLYNTATIPNGSAQLHEHRYAVGMIEDYFNGAGMSLVLR
jgi:hypothetical protein